MASFYAELWLEGYKFPLRTCSYGLSQATDYRGRVISKVRTSLIDCLLDVPEPPILTDWATDPTKQLPGKIVFFAAQGGAALETVAWAAAWCVGYQEDFISGDRNQGAYVCRIRIAAPVIQMLAGGPSSHVAPAAGEPAGQQQAGAPVLERVVETAKAVEVVETVTGWTVLTRLAQGLTRLLTSAPALTAALVLTPTNSRDDDGYKAEWNLNKMMQAPTDKDRARLAYLEAEQAQRALTDTEADELASLLAVVRKVFVGGRTGLPVYYAQQAAAQHLRQIVPDFREVRLIHATHGVSGEFDGINMKEGLFIEDKSAEGLNIINPRTGLKEQTAEKWAKKAIFKKTAKRIDSLAGASATLPSESGTPTVPAINQIRGFRRLHFRIEADTPEVRKAVDTEIRNLSKQYPDWDFTAQYGK